jgi:hypothetical protein
MGRTRNGELLRAAEDASRGIASQSRRCRRSSLLIIGKNPPKTIAAFDAAAPGFFQSVDIGTFSRKKPTGN